MIRHGAHFFTQKDSHRRHRLLHIHAIPFQFLDAFRKELVVVNERPKVAEVQNACESEKELDDGLAGSQQTIHRAKHKTYRHRLL